MPGRRHKGPSSGSLTRMHDDCAVPRPTRPRSWWSCERPKRSASSMTITVAFGTSIADLDDGRRDEHLRAPVPERLHRARALVHLHAPVQHVDLHALENRGAEARRELRRRLGLEVVRLLDQGQTTYAWRPWVT